MVTTDWTRVTKNYRKHKSAVTRAENRKDWPAVMTACKAAFADFAEHGYPDNWSHFQRAADDAVVKMRMEVRSW